MIIELKQGFRSRFNMRSLARLWHPGVYTVGLDMPREVADAAIKAGSAVEIQPAVAEPVKTEGEAVTPQPTFRGRRARRAAPENKSEVE